jgi:hypothetical protein
MDRSLRMREAQAHVRMARDTVSQMTKNGATIHYLPGVIHANGGDYVASAYIAASEYLTTDITIPSGAYLNSGDYVVIAEMGSRAWVSQVLPASLFARLAIDYSNGVIYSGNGSTPPRTPVTLGGGGVSNPNTGDFTTTQDLIAGDDIYLSDGLRWYPVAGNPSGDYDISAHRSATKTLTIDDGAGAAVTVNVVGTLQEDGTQVSVVGHTHTYAPDSVDYLVGTASGSLSGEIVVGATPGGELGGTWASPTVDTTHSGTSHAGVISTHESATFPHSNVICVYSNLSATDSFGSNIGTLSIVPFGTGDAMLNVGSFTFNDTNDTIAVPTTGKYWVEGWVRWTNNATGQRRITIRVGSTNTLEDTGNPGISQPHGHRVAGFLDLTSGDTLSLYCAQNSGGNLTITQKQIGAWRVS